MLLKTPTDAKTTMMDDPLRILRALRFSLTKGMEIDDEIMKAMQQTDILQKLQQTVSQERIREEVLKMMKFDTVKTMQLLVDVDRELIPGLLQLTFKDNMWLEPTTKKR
jgi:tRNA nucleotidyltransferase/poly(A) polymerase